jgi:hypothetical protein
MRLLLVGSALVGVSSAAPAQTLKTDLADPEAIVVHGKRSEQYRIPEELRTLRPEKSERWRKLTNRDLSCQQVGPRGCGTPVLPIFTVGGDGKVRIGQKSDGE